MALWSPRLQKFLLNNNNHRHQNLTKIDFKNTNHNNNIITRKWTRQGTRRRAIAIDAPSSLSDGLASGIRWGSAKLQGAREDMEDDAVVFPNDNDLAGFSFAAVFDGHAGFSSVNFLREELCGEAWPGLVGGRIYKNIFLQLKWGGENVYTEKFLHEKHMYSTSPKKKWGGGRPLLPQEAAPITFRALQGGQLLNITTDFTGIKNALQDAFHTADAKLLNWLETNGEEEDESGATATAMFIGNDMLFISHVGDSSAVLSQSGKAQELTNSHRPFGRNKVSLQEIKRIREAGGWISDGRICGDISVSRAFGDIRFKTKKNEMLRKGVAEGRWSQKFVSRIQFVDDLVIATPDIYQAALGPDAEFVLLATDGLWDYIKSSDAVSFVRNQLREHGDVQVASEALAQMALDQYSQDNVTIVIADLGRTNWEQLPIEQQNFVYEVIQAFATIGIVSLGIWMSSNALF